MRSLWAWIRRRYDIRRRSVALARLQKAVANGAVDLGILEDERNYRR